MLKESSSHLSPAFENNFFLKEIQMTNSEILKLLQSSISEIKEIPYPEAPIGAPAHEGKPYRDAYLYVSCPAKSWLDCAKILKDDESLSFDFLTFITAVDYVKVSPAENPRIEMVYHFYSFKYRHKCVVKVSLPRENPSADSVIGLWSAADWQEREVYDMFGVKFNGHPNCTRILMWEGFPGWPLRKDYAHVPDRYDD